MTDLDQDILRTLRDHAEGPVDTDRLLARSVAGGRRRRRHRRALLGGGLALVALLGGVAVGPGLPGVSRPFTATGPAGTTGPVPPVVGAAPGAAAAPQVIGTDPQVLHFGIDPARARYLGWGVVRGVETIQVDVGDGQTVTVDVANSVAALRNYVFDGQSVEIVKIATEAAFDGRTSRVTANGRPVQVRHWHPAPGVYARATVQADTDTGLRVAARALRVDEARRCTGPVRVTSLPSGSRTASCQVDVSHSPGLITARIDVSRPGEQRMSLSYRYAIEAGMAPEAGNTEVDGKPAQLDPGPPKTPAKGQKPEVRGRLELLGLGKARLVVQWGWPYYGFDEVDAAVVLAGARVADPTRPDTWD
ncbi:hypothetical protein [Micromonospora siamensis]|uniref:Uncharacterized protein n=1 Tax=Micromonospora siamensis TaxID=299152 RepID=A0A1C5JYU1_9ACTN|nr:hypothetical protein [Micromonospora siamensis]SCG75715.1 hypothetical protein GA0074704_5218 [Micromonospora siamensis]